MHFPRKPNTVTSDKKDWLAALRIAGIYIFLHMLAVVAVILLCWRFMTYCDSWQTKRHREALHIENVYVLPTEQLIRTAGKLTFTSCFTLKDGYTVTDAAGETIILQDITATPSMASNDCLLLMDVKGNLLDKQACDCGFSSDALSIYTYSDEIFYTGGMKTALSLTDGTELTQNAAVCWRGKNTPAYVYSAQDGAYLGETAPFEYKELAKKTDSELEYFNRLYPNAVRVTDDLLYLDKDGVYSFFSIRGQTFTRSPFQSKNVLVHGNVLVVDDIVWKITAADPA